MNTRISSNLWRHRFSTILAALTGVGQEKRTSSAPFHCFDYWPVNRLAFGWKKNVKPIVFVCLFLTLSLGALSQGIDEGEFSQVMLAHKLYLLKSQFEQAQAELLMRSGAEPKITELERVDTKIKSLEAEFWRGRYYPDLFDEQIVIVREELRLILTDARGMSLGPKRTNEAKQAGLKP